MSQFGSNSPSVVPSLGTATSGTTVTTDVNFNAAVEATVSTMSAVGLMGNEATAIIRTVRFIDFGICDAMQYWERVVRPNLTDFRQDPTPKSARNLGTSLWEVINWLWYDRHPSEDDRSPAYKQFCADQIGKCGHMDTMREIANAWKHRGLSRGKISTARTNAPTYEIGFDNGVVVPMNDAFEEVVAYLEREIYGP